MCILMMFNALSSHRMKVGLNHHSGVILGEGSLPVTAKDTHLRALDRSTTGGRPCM